MGGLILVGDIGPMGFSSGGGIVAHAYLESGGNRKKEKKKKKIKIKGSRTKVGIDGIGSVAE